MDFVSGKHELMDGLLAPSSNEVGLLDTIALFFQNLEDSIDHIFIFYTKPTKSKFTPITFLRTDKIKVPFFPEQALHFMTVMFSSADHNRGDKLITFVSVVNFHASILQEKKKDQFSCFHF